MGEQPKYLDVETFEAFEHDDPIRCAVCGDDLVAGDQVVWEPEPLMGERACVLAHAGCSIRNGYRLRWPTPPEPLDSTLMDLLVYEDGDSGWTDFNEDLEYTDQGFVVQCPRHLWSAHQAALAAVTASHETLCTTLGIHAADGVMLEACHRPDCEQFVVPAHEFKARNGDTITIPDRTGRKNCRNCGHHFEAHETPEAHRG